MSTLSSLAKAQAVDRGIAQPLATVRHVHVSDRPLVLVALTLAGEANAPLAVMVGDGLQSATRLIVTQPRDRAERFAFAERLAQVVLGYINARRGYRELLGPGPGGEPRTRLSDAPQVIVPNPATVGFLRLLGRSTRFRRTTGDYPVDPSVPVLGRWLTYLAERAEVPGSCLMLAATQALATHWASGQSAVEDLNLAALMGWIAPPPGRTGQQAAAAAEDPLTWPPAGPATDPTFDNEVLAPLIAACDRPGLSPVQRQAAVIALESALAGQLTPTWQLMWHAVALLRSLPPGGRVEGRWESDRDSFTRYWDYVRDGGAPQPRRDSAVAAAQRLSWLERAQASYAVQRAFDDPLVMAEYRLTGEAFGGVVTAAEPARTDSPGKRRRLRPLICVATDDVIGIEPGAALVSPARPAQTARVVSVSVMASEPGGPACARSGVQLELAGGMGRSLTAEPGSVPAVGERVTYTTLADSYQPRGTFPSREETPWTHGGPPPVYVPADEDAAEAWS